MHAFTAQLWKRGVRHTINFFVRSYDIIEGRSFDEIREDGLGLGISAYPEHPGRHFAGTSAGFNESHNIETQKTIDVLYQAKFFSGSDGTTPATPIKWA